MKDPQEEKRNTLLNLIGEILDQANLAELDVIYRVIKGYVKR